jgi:hypothetical protein
MVWLLNVSEEVLMVADTGAVALPKVPVIGVPAPLAPSESTKYSAAAIVVLPEVLTVAFRLTEVAPLVGFGVAVRPETTGGAITLRVMSW